MPQSCIVKFANKRLVFGRIFLSCILTIIVISCSYQPAPADQIEEISKPPTGLPVPSATPTRAYENDGNLTSDQIATLSSLKKIGDHPLYVMTYFGDLPDIDYITQSSEQMSVDRKILNDVDGWACSLFAALGGNQDSLFGRNFDWEHSPAMLLFSNPPGRFASAAMVDLSYLGFNEKDLGRLHELELTERIPLLDTPNWPFDGLNERGLAIGMAAVPGSKVTIDPNKPSIGSLEIMRKVLDHAANIDEAVNIMENYNIDFQGGPDIHYLIADKSGTAVLVEYLAGKLHTIYNSEAWHQATNYYVSSADQQLKQCARYDRIAETMHSNDGNLDLPAAHQLLAEVSQNSTQWSVIYNLDLGIIQVSMSRHYDQLHEFQLIP